MPVRQPFTQLCQHLAALASRTKTDLHTHTTYSDGAHTVAELITEARARGLAGLAITDHDTLSGYDEAQRIADRLPRPPLRRSLGGMRPVLRLIAGVEITSEYAGRELHLLGYFVDPSDGSLRTALERLQQARRERMAAMLERCHELGVPISADTAATLPASPGRPHMANLLVKAGHVKTYGEAFGRFLHPGGPLDLPKLRLPVDEAIALVRGAGGVASWAHPPADCSLEQVNELRAMGLNALETEYPWPSKQTRNQLRRLAAQAGLAVTGGSDCHGPGSSRPVVGTHGLSAMQLTALQASLKLEARL